MPTPVDAGNEIVVPLFNAESAEKLVHIKWSQNLATREADYYSLTADNVTTGQHMLFSYDLRRELKATRTSHTGEQFVFFIAAEYYKNSTKANANHITKVGELVEGGMHAKYHSLAFSLRGACRGLQVEGRLSASVWPEECCGRTPLRRVSRRGAKAVPGDLFYSFWLEDEAEIGVGIFSIASWRLLSDLRERRRLTTWPRSWARVNWEIR
jgi:hypothetical protein